MQTSRREILDDFLDFVGEQNDSNARSTAARALNRAIHTVWMKHPWRQFVMPSPLQISTIASQRSYALPEHFGRVSGGVIRNLSTGARLSGIELAVLQDAHPEQGSTLEETAEPELYAVGGTCGVSLLAAAPEALTVVSDSATDTNVRVTVEGYDVGNRWRRQNVSLNGTNPVAIPASVIAWTFGKSVVAGTTPTTELTSSVGTVTLTGAVSGALQSLLAYESGVEHQLLTLYPMPSIAAETIAIPYLRAPVRTLYDGDVVPMNWEEAVMEEMLIQWRVNTGEMPADSTNILRPKLLDLIAFENSNRFGVRPATRPYTG